MEVILNDDAKEKASIRDELLCSRQNPLGAAGWCAHNLGAP
jgi:hypothetical protein